MRPSKEQIEKGAEAYWDCHLSTELGGLHPGTRQPAAHVPYRELAANIKEMCRSVSRTVLEAALE